MKTYFLTYSNNKYELFQKKSEIFAEKEGFDFIISKKRKDILNSDLYIKYSNILDFNPNKGDGYCLWKPYIILDTLKQINDNDIIIYSDCADNLKEGLKNFVLNYMKLNDYLLVNNTHLNKNWTKRDCFYYMECDNEKYWNTTQLEAGFCVFKKTQKNIDFVNEWLNFCSNEDILVMKENTCGLKNLNGFIDHRYDQSVLTNLSVKYNMITLPIFTMVKFIDYNFFDSNMIK
jgi:hypothetical protein